MRACDRKVSGHPRVTKAAVFDIISPDVVHGQLASAAEILILFNDIITGFPTLDQTYELHISHSKRTWHFFLSDDDYDSAN